MSCIILNSSSVAFSVTRLHLLEIVFVVAVVFVFVVAVVFSLDFLVPPPPPPPPAPPPPPLPLLDLGLDVLFGFELVVVFLVCFVVVPSFCSCPS